MKKNNHFRNKLLTSATLLTGGLMAVGQTPQKPNIVLFMVDDMGWQDTSVPFWEETTPYNEICHTPNMQRLADQGVKFTNAYACAISSPTRTSLMTGMNMARHRVTNWTLKHNTSTDAHDNVLNFPSWNYNGLQPANATPINNGLNATSLAQLLKDNGYFTIHTGKGHWGSRSTLGANPKNLGFDINIAGSETGGPASYYGKNNFGTGDFHVKGLEEFHGQDIYLTEALTQKALSTLSTVRKTNQQPFYLYMAHYAIHIPIQKDPRFEQRYKNKGLSEREIAYLTMIEGMDKSLGDIMDYLDTNNLTENTIVIFMSDNGGHNSVGNVTKNNKAYPHNYPLRGAKGSAYEGGIREPMIVKWPNVTTPNTKTDEPVIIEDFFPSILEMAGVTNYTTIQDRDGVSFVPILKNEPYTNKERALYWHFPNRWGETADGSETYSSIIQNEYKYIYRWKTGVMELYNIKNDIGEKNDLIQNGNQADMDKAKELAKKLSDYLRSVNAQRPTYKSTGAIIPWPDQAKMPTPPVKPDPSNDTTEHWYKIHDNRDTHYYWTVNSSKQLKLTTETIPNDTTTADKLFKIVPTADGQSYNIYAMSHPQTPITATNTADNTPLYANSTNPISEWTLTPSTAVPNYYLIAAKNDGRQLNSYSSSNTMFVSFWMPENGDTDKGNRWAFIPGVLRQAPQLTAYPAMKRYFTNPTAPHEQAASRYLTEVSVKIDGKSKNIISTTTNPTETQHIKTNTHYPNAVVNKTTPPIVIPKKITQFELTCLGSQDNPRNLRWAQQNVFIDWNKDFDFLDENESGERSTTTSPFDTHITAPGYTRTIQIPSNTASGTYRMRVIYHESDSEWKTSIWSNNLIKNGIAYDFDLQIEEGTSTNKSLVKTPLFPISITNGVVSIEGTDAFELFHISGRQCDTKQAQPQGVYLVKAQQTVQKVIIR